MKKNKILKDLQLYLHICNTPTFPGFSEGQARTSRNNFGTRQDIKCHIFEIGDGVTGTRRYLGIFVGGPPKPVLSRVVKI